MSDFEAIQWSICRGFGHSNDSQSSPVNLWYGFGCYLDFHHLLFGCRSYMRESNHNYIREQYEMNLLELEVSWENLVEVIRLALVPKTVRHFFVLLSLCVCVSVWRIYFTSNPLKNDWIRSIYFYYKNGNIIMMEIVLHMTLGNHSIDDTIKSSNGKKLLALRSRRTQAQQ